MRSFFLIGVLAFVLMAGLQPAASAAQGSVLVVRISSDISGPTTELVAHSIAEAQAGGARLIVYELNTPGGDLGSVTNIMNAFNSSPIPVVVWVTPSGAAAWSGGTYILMASHIAVMASGTTIGSAQPVTATGQTVNETKIINALTGLMRDNARLHDRNETIAQEFITQNINLGPEEALRDHVIEFAADSLDGLLSQLEPYTLVLSTGEMGTSVWKLVLTSSTGAVAYTRSYDFSGISQAAQYNYQPGISIAVLQFLSNPLIATVLFLVGMYAVIIGFKTPGYGVEIAGALMVFLALVGYGIIGINIAAVLLFILGIILTLIEIKTHVGIFALAGIGMIILGSFLMFPLPGWELLAAQSVESARETLIAVALVMSGIFGFVVYKVAQARRMKVKMGPERLMGKTGTAVSALAPRGEVKVEGQTWRAETLGENIKEGQEVEIVRREGLILRVKPKQAQK
ncbi:MAG: nodulation protein NfeD [Candidatus Bathyarchaeia archaeon]|jgi:membrane-bound serine protease (ClpP class)